ncbi:MAG TPA: hypothetical protein VNJ01_09950 [Bacteriovoracaceae bacterium]|nr:hypothetical protein [Bacteriovoracaceae bacterium]
MKYSNLFVLLLIAACSNKKGMLENQTLKGHKELYSEPAAPKVTEPLQGVRRLVIASTNDIQGNYRTRTIPVSDDSNDDPSSISVGGAAAIHPYYKILRDQYKDVLLVDSGDLLSNLDVKFSRKFYSKLGYDALTIGTSDFNVKLPADVNSSAELFQSFARKSKVPLILSNLFELKTGRVVEWEGAKPYVIKEINGTKVGIIGLIPNDIVTQTPVNNRVGFFVENMLQSTLRHARLMRSLGAEVIVVLTHQGIDCTSEASAATKLPEKKVNFEPRHPNICDLKSPLGEFLERLPPGLVDVVAGGRINKKASNFINGTLVLSGYEDGLSFSFAEFFIDEKTKKVIPEKTVVHQPVFFCHEFFEETNDCFYEDESVDHKKRIPATFLGKKIVLEPDLEKKFPELNLKNAAIINNGLEVSRSLVEFEADITYLPVTGGDAQLAVLNLKGSTLARILEQDFNESKSTSWLPSPFIQKGEELQLLIKGLELDHQKTYRVLTDLHAVQKNTVLVGVLEKMDSRILTKESWNGFWGKADSVNTAAAAPAR